MRNGFLGSITILLAEIGLAFGQPAPAPPPGQVLPSAPGKGAVPTGPVERVAPPTGSAGPVAGQPAPYMPDVESPRSPYWPSLANCTQQGCGPGGCGGNGVDFCQPGSPPQHHHETFWGGAEYLVWWIKDGPMNVPLVTTSPPGSLGVIGAPGTEVLFGDSGFNFEAFSGARLTLGIWLDKCDHRWAWESSGFFLERRKSEFLAVSSVTGTPVLARPFVNAITGAEDAHLVSAPGQFAGDIGIGSSSGFYGFESNLVYANFYTQNNIIVDLLGGLRYLSMREDLGAFQTSTLLSGGTAGFSGAILTAPATVDIIDRIQTRSEFYGGQFGARGEYRMGGFFVNARGKLAFGSSHEIVAIDGASRLSNSIAAGGTVQPPITVPNGFLALSSNVGRYSRDRFSVVPEIGFNVGYQCCETIRLFMGYTFLYWSDVVRPGDQVSRTINPTTIPTSQAFGVPIGPAQPAFAFQHSDFWAQGLNFGLEIRY